MIGKANLFSAILTAFVFPAPAGSLRSKETLQTDASDKTVNFPAGIIEGDEEKIRFTWGVKSLPWLILTDNKHIVHAEGFALSELSEKLNQMDNK